MDLNSIETVSVPARRSELLSLADGDAILAGGTWLFSQPQPQVRQLVDITGLGWEPITLGDNGIELAATCTLADISALSGSLVHSHPEWLAAPLLHQCCTALLASFKIWRTATIGGNICLSFPAGAMVSLVSALDGTLTVWRPDGREYRLPVTEFVTGEAANVLAPGEILRSVHLPGSALRGRTAFRKLAPSALGRSSAVVIGRRDHDRDGGAFVLSVTAATVRPFVFEFPALPDAASLRAACATIPDDAWTRDAHGDPDWRAAITPVLAEQVRSELA
ncbi:FAD binding domain-containing protein [Mycobacterium sp. CVI_P3]|uniref:FAD binding domain-containing protein n=1 Tax=Mycobacterium pinniadriaticum TaxID=2994102 RepID=A0ABT3S822_9MYCO|nr:FAD binding domain-containing protein [Mycobacterium pinniadriaticum]MCX2929233.1 FAD binding domain-containing protein [Mycobacterium pinniadriaticum]MCX2935658.1 FAD binding domain-containing protein [Mycobacterium pinniadriaticum]